ncbi:site-specific DNA-methyltransferase (adenine-specific) [Arthrobacter sp. ok909]|uniref:MT-A70 family methyltransferase n=1 Tax=Arthrobacter sp. ok909 TaxID=1761746 RepID=UPI00088B0F15|nr:MT-A70 family methyltransferase [Arthrobacter sp. ok909]SDP32767.1 site-specific DNA-methyltransferase (adenine-specific) [Arthrobacter sp. ok909]
MKKYSVIYADPPWEYRQSGGITNSRGMAKQHYPTMRTRDICDLAISELADEQCVLFMWATFPNIFEAEKVMEAWGFEYKTAAFLWVKQNRKTPSLFWGMGAYTRANAEVCLLGIKKGTRATEVVKQRNVHQVILAPVTRHSEKPQEARDRITSLMGDVSRVELFARKATEGWDVWGNEVENDIELTEAA